MVGHVGGVVLDFSAMTATRSGEPVHLRAGEWRLLARLYGAAGKVCYRDDLLRDVFECEVSRVLDTTVGTLRRKLGFACAGPLVTVNRCGYRLDR